MPFDYGTIQTNDAERRRVKWKSDPGGKITYAELSTILGALRLFQETQEVLSVKEMPHFLDCEPLTNEEIDDLCERLNLGDIVEVMGAPA